MPKKIILDVDTGSDDAIALMTAILSPDIDLVAACSVAGNNPIRFTTENTLRVVEAMDADVPVYRGASAPVMKDLMPDRLPDTARHSFERDGEIVQIHRKYLDLPAATRIPEPLPAAMFYVDYLRRAAEPVTLVLVGPLTNFAIALMMDPDIVKNVEEIIIMGGGDQESNVSVSAEFNVFFDPEAALWVLRSGAKITWVPLDATHAAYLTAADADALRATDSLAGKCAADLLEQRIVIHSHLQPLEVPDAAAVHDALAVCYAIDPTVLNDVHHVHMAIGLSGYADGQTIIDPRYYPEARNCHFAYGTDRVKFGTMLREILGNGPKA